MAIDSQLQPGEKVLYRAHPSQIGLVLPAIVAVAALFGSFLLHQRDDMLWPSRVLGAVAVLALLYAIWKYLALQSFHYVLTDRRVLHETGFFSRTSKDTYLDKINNVEHRQSFWGRMVGIGDVEIDTASGTGAALYPRISRPLDWKRAIDAAAAAYRSRGPVVVPAAAVAPVPSVTPAVPVTGAEKIRQLKQLLDDGLISAEEFEEKRKRLLAEI